MMINEFRGEYYFLSNFSDSKIEMNGVIFDNAEAAFHSFKDLSKQSEFANLDSNTAKRKGRTVRLRDVWEQVKCDIMYQVVKAKFTQNEDLKKKLLATGNEKLVEGNTWNDSYWGMCQGKGQNMLGRILMSVREELKGDIQMPKLISKIGYLYSLQGNKFNHFKGLVQYNKSTNITIFYIPSLNRNFQCAVDPGIMFKDILWLETDNPKLAIDILINDEKAKLQAKIDELRNKMTILDDRYKDYL